MQNISFEVSRGEIVAFVGPSGSGKTTLVKLLVSLYRPHTGHIYYNGTREDEIGIDGLGEKIGFVTQDAQLFSGSIRRYFAQAICNIDYVHIPDLAPTAEILDPYRKGKHADWDLYQRQFLELIHSRKVGQTLSPGPLDNSSCSAAIESPDHCHRRLVAESVQDAWRGVEVEHIL